MKLIDKDALVAEIENIRKHYIERDDFDNGWNFALDKVLSFIDTLDVKDVNLEHEVESYWKQCDMTWCRDAYSMTHIRSMLSDVVKHFFELGLRVQKGEDV